MARLNVKFTDHAYEAIQWLSEVLGSPKAAIVRDAISLYYWIAKELAAGNKLLIQRGDSVTELVIPSLEGAQDAAAKNTAAKHAAAEA